MRNIQNINKKGEILTIEEIAVEETLTYEFPEGRILEKLIKKEE